MTGTAKTFYTGRHKSKVPFDCETKGGDFGITTNMPKKSKIGWAKKVLTSALI